MTDKERYISALTFGNPDKIPLQPGGPRESTVKRWIDDGMPREALNIGPVNYILTEVLGISFPGTNQWHGFWMDSRMNPWFEEKVLEHKDGVLTVQDWMGATTQILDKYDVTYIRNAKDFVTRKWIRFPVTCREEWEDMKKRYDAFDPTRLPQDLEKMGKASYEYNGVTHLYVNGPFWQLREWMGMEELCVAFIERPDLVSEMISFWCDFVTDLFKRFLPYIRVDWVTFQEDMAYKVHPMIGPEMTREFIGPTYKKWAELLKLYNVPVLSVDSDGYVDDLIPVWLESGFNLNEPVEVAAGNDIVAMREKYGRSIGYVGGIDKRCIAAGGRTMYNEVMRCVPPLLKDGGYIPGCDHAVPPDISYQNYIEYSRLLAQLTGWL